MSREIPLSSINKQCKSLLLHNDQGNSVCPVCSDANAVSNSAVLRGLAERMERLGQNQEEGKNGAVHCEQAGAKRE